MKGSKSNAPVSKDIFHYLQGRKRKISDEEEEGKKEGFKESGTPSNEGSDSAPVSSKVLEFLNK